MWALLKGLPIGHYFVMGAILVASYIWMDYKHTKQELADQIVLTEQWRHAAEVQQDIDRRDTIIIRASREADRAIQEAPNANTPIPPDVAHAWATGIDSVRDAGSKPADGEHDMPGPSNPKAERGGSDSRTAGSVLKGSRGSFLAV